MLCCGCGKASQAERFYRRAAYLYDKDIHLDKLINAIRYPNKRVDQKTDKFIEEINLEVLSNRWPEDNDRGIVDGIDWGAAVKVEPTPGADLKHELGLEDYEDMGAMQPHA